MKLFRLSKRVGIDLGTANCLVYVVGEGIVMEEPPVGGGLRGRPPGNRKARKPMRDGVIADYVVTEAMMRYFLRKVGAGNQIFKPEVMVCVPAGVTQVERRAVLSATMSAGA